MLYRRLLTSAALLLLFIPLAAQPPGGKDKAGKTASADKGKKSDTEMVERLLAARREYQIVLENLRAYYLSVGDIERAKWAEEELIQFHRIAKHAFDLQLDVPPPTLQGAHNIPEANELYRRAMTFKDRGWGTDYTDNQRRAEILLQQLLSNYPQSDKISDAAYQLGDIYQSAAYKQYERAAMYFERCFQWNPKTGTDARLRAARLHERNNERERAIRIYKEITTHEIDQKRVDEAQRRLAELGARR